MKRSLLLSVALLAGCAGHAVDTSFDLALTAKRIEQACGLTHGSLLHPISQGVLELRPATPIRPSYAQFACVTKGIEQERLERRGVRVLLIGEEAAG